MLSSPLAAAIVVLATGFTSIPEASAACLSAAETRTAVAGGEAVPLSKISRAIRRNKLGDLISAKLCRRGSLVYEVTILTADGSVRRFRINARTGSFR